MIYNLVPQNAFSRRLGHTGFNIFSSLIVDLLHEFEIGVFKSLFIHLIRILDASATGSTLIHELDKRFVSPSVSAPSPSPLRYV
jgi:hypothetical protein